MRRRNPNAGIVVFWVKLRQRGYTRSISGLYRFLRKRGQMAVKRPNPKYIPKPYEKMTHPGQRVQIDVKYVPASCLVGQARQDAADHIRHAKAALAVFGEKAAFLTALADATLEREN